MSLFLYVLADIIHLVKIILLCDVLFEFRRRKIWDNRVLFGCIGFIVSILSIIIYTYDNEAVEIIAYIVAIMVLLSILYNEKVHSVAIVSIWIIFVLAMIDTMIIVLYNISMNLLNINGELISNLIVSIVSLIFVYSISRIFKRNNSIGIRTIGIVHLFWYTLLMTVDALVVNTIAVMNLELIWEKHRNIYLIAVVFVIIGIFIQLIAVILLFMQRNVYKEKKLLTEKYLNEQKNHYVYLETREQETKKFRHDLRSHMELISNLAKNREYEKIDSYLEKMNIKIDSFGNIITVQNGIVDAIINQYYEKAQQSKITMEVRGRFPEECAIDAYDLCTIFSNVLSNALEAAIETEEKTISLECRYNDKNIIIVVKNSYNSEQQNGTSQWRTRKENTDYHGYGLENMKDSVEKYNGVFDIETNNNIFTLTILFNNMGKQGYENCNC